jgi:uncharacterized repeat protein (TIGR03843 family)
VSGAARRGLRTTLAVEEAVRLLEHGDLELEGRLRGASNTTLRAFVTLDGVSARCVYKPIAGERPLWDFPDGTLAAREVAAYVVSAATGWDIVPPTVLRDGPLGPGACQLWVETRGGSAARRVGFVPADALPAGWRPIATGGWAGMEGMEFVTASDEEGGEYVLAHADDPALARIALLDVVINNADRKGGHVLPARDGKLHGVDHGVTFHIDDKLRTVLWGFIGRPVPDEEVAVLAALRSRLDGSLRESLCSLLDAEEVAATVFRLDRLLAAGTFPAPGPGRHAMPWPPI